MEAIVHVFAKLYLILVNDLQTPFKDDPVGVIAISIFKIRFNNPKEPFRSIIHKTGWHQQCFFLKEGLMCAPKWS